MRKDIVECVFSLSLPLIDNKNKIQFTKQAIEKAMNSFKDAPIVDKNDGVIGIVTEANWHDKDELIIKGKLWTRIEPELSIQKKENNTILDFNFSALWINI